MTICASLYVDELAYCEKIQSSKSLLYLSVGRKEGFVPAPAFPRGQSTDSMWSSECDVMNVYAQYLELLIDKATTYVMPKGYCTQMYNVQTIRKDKKDSLENRGQLEGHRREGEENCRHREKNGL